MLLNLCGAHAPYFTRNIVILKDSPEHVRRGPGGEASARRSKRRSRWSSVSPSDSTTTSSTPCDTDCSIRAGRRTATAHKVTSASEAAVLKQPHEINLRTDNVLTAIESAHSSTGPVSGVPVAALLGTGQHRKAARMLGYLFYVGDRTRPTCLCQTGSGARDHWYRVRNEEAVTPEGIVRQAEAASALYGFNDFKLKGGVMSEFANGRGGGSQGPLPTAGVTLDPNGAWLLDEAIGLCKDAAIFSRMPRTPAVGKRLPARNHGRVQARYRHSDGHQHGGHGLAPA